MILSFPGRRSVVLIGLYLTGKKGAVAAQVSGAGDVAEGAAPAVEVAAVERRKAGELLARAVEALGGAARLDAVKSVETSGELAIGRDARKVRHDTILVFPDRLRQETGSPLGPTVRVVNGGCGLRPDRTPGTAAQGLVVGGRQQPAAAGPRRSAAPARRR